MNIRSHSTKQTKGFTLIELLVVIGILAILATTAVLILNPAERLAEARDASRLNDVSAIRRAISLAGVSGTLDGDGPNYTYSCRGQVDPGDSNNHQKLFVSVPQGNGEASPTISGWTVARATAANLYKVDGAGWLPIDFQSNGAPFSVLPVDPTNTFSSGLYYSYVCGSYGFGLRFESNKFKAQFYAPGTNVYETGSAPSELPDLPPAGTEYSAASAPVISSANASPVAASAATLNGLVNPNGADTTAWFRYDTANPGTCDNIFGTDTSTYNLGGDFSNESYSHQLTGLPNSTSYYFCAIADNSEGTTYGEIESFTTYAPPNTAPTVITVAATSITTNSAAINGTANPNSVSSTGWFRYRATPSASCEDNNTWGTRVPASTLSDTALGSGGEPVAYSQNLAGLASGATYYYCAIANNIYGTITGAVVPFTSVGPPTVETTPATSVTANAATLNGSASPNGLATTGYFRYRTTSSTTCVDDNSWGTRAPASSSADATLGSGSAAITYSQFISGLTSGATYYYCAVAQNSSGTSLGEVLSFSDTTGVPSVSTGGAYVTRPTAATFAGVSSGSVRNCASLSDGTVKCWGSYSNAGMPTFISGISTAIQVSQGGGHACALLSDSTIKCWGDNYSGQLGNGSTTGGYYPVSVLGISTATQVSAGLYHTCALLSDSTIKCWGDNYSGQLGNGTTSDSSTPVLVSGIANATQVSLGRNYTCARLLDSTIKCWGINTYGQLGTPSTTSGSSTPVTITGITNATQVSAGDGHVCARLSDSTIKCWGSNGSGQLGSGSTANTFITPVLVPGVVNAISVSAGYNHSCAVISGGTMSCWGSNQYGGLGNGTTSTSASTPVTVSGISTAINASAAYNHTCAHLSDSTIKCWGWNNYGQLGDGTTTNSSVPVSVATSSATLNGTADANGATTTGWFRYRTTLPSPYTCVDNDSWGTRIPLTSGTVSEYGTVYFSENIVSLAPSTTYYFCAIASNSFGTSVANNVGSFSTVPTSSSAPTTTTVAATAITTSSATINGSTNPNGYSTRRWFIYDTEDPGYCYNYSDGTRVPEESSPYYSTSGPTLGSGTSPVAYSENLTGLSSGTTYFYCAFAYNMYGVSPGIEVLSFTTADIPTATTFPATSITTTTATLNGSSNPHGLATTAWFRYDTSDPGACNNTFGTDTSPVSSIPSGTSTAAYSADISGLTPGVTYYYCALASNSYGLNVGSILSFATTTSGPSAGSPAVVTTTSTTSTSALLASQISASYSHTCTLQPDSSVVCFGYNGNGQLGNGTTVFSFKPVTVAGISTATQVTSGESHSCALLSSGSIKCWGENEYGKLGNGTTVNSLAPVSVAGISNATQVSAGYNNTCARLSDGTVKCWGGAYLGNGSTSSSSTPVSVSGILNATQVSAGYAHACARLSDGTVKCWGDNGNGQIGDSSFSDRLTPVSVSGVSTATQVATGYRHSCALLSGGAIKCWGYSDSGQIGDGSSGNNSYALTPVSVSGISTATQLSAGYRHNCARLSDSTIRCWGNNNYGQLGDGTTTNAPYPVAVSGISNATQTAAGGHHTCALLSGGAIKCWGNTSQGATGSDFSWPQTNTPVSTLGIASATINGSANPKGVASTGWFRYSAVNPGVCDDVFGIRAPALGGVSLGAGTSVAPYSQNITGLSVNTIYYFCAIASNSAGTDTGSIQVITTSTPPTTATGAATNIAATTATLNGTGNPNGYSSTGWFRYSLSNPLTCIDYTSQTRVPANSSGDSSLGSGTSVVAYSQNVTGLAAHTTYYYCALTLNSSGTGAGQAQYFTTLPETQSSDAPTVVTQTADTANTKTSAATQVSASANYTCALISGGTVNCWAAVPFAVPTISSAIQVSKGDNHTCVLFPDGTIKCWGYNAYGQLGNGTTTDSTTLVAVSGISNAVEVSAGSNYTCARLSTGAIQCWGRNGDGQLGNGTTIQSSSPVNALSISNAAQISAGGNHTCARLADSTIKCWGSNTYGQIGDGSTTSNSAPGAVVSGISNATQVSAGSGFTCARLSDSTLRCWGYNGNGQLGNGTTTSSSTPVSVVGILTSTQVSAGGNHTCARLSDSTLRCWGYNGYGQLGSGAISGNSPAPVAVVGIANATQISAGGGYACALLSDTTIKCWGQAGSLGNGNTSSHSSVPVAVSVSSATLNGTGNPNGLLATGWFRYSSINPTVCDDTFGTRVPADSSSDSNLGNLTGAQSYSEDITGLTTSVTYYYCAIAENSAGKGYGQLITFTIVAP